MNIRWAVVTLPYDQAWEALYWAKKNCPGYITHNVHKFENWAGDSISDHGKIDYLFSNEKEALIFTLMWVKK